MPYAAYPYRKMAYDTDGTVVLAYRNNTMAYETLNLTQKTNLNSWEPTTSPAWIVNSSSSNGGHFIFVFPELRTFTRAFVLRSNANFSSYSLQYSTDTTNGIDGTWSNASDPSVTFDAAISDRWRTTGTNYSLVSAISGIKFTWASSPGATHNLSMYKIHLYGNKNPGETPNDLIYTNVSGSEFTQDIDYGDVTTGDNSTVTSFKLKNTSLTKTASGIIVYSSGSELQVSRDGNDFSSSVSVSAIGPSDSSPTLYARARALATLSPVVGPRAPRIYSIVTVWNDPVTGSVNATSVLLKNQSGSANSDSWFVLSQSSSFSVESEIA